MRVAAILAVAALLLSFAACTGGTPDLSGIFTDGEKMSYSRSYRALASDRTNNTSDWRQGMVSGNGSQGVITSGAPYDDTLIFQNIHFIIPNQNVRYCPDTADELETVKQHIVAGEDIVDDASYDDVYYFHPGGALRITQEERRASDYIRYTDYETAEVGVRYSDELGEWSRTTFTSQADGVTVTRIDRSSEGEKIDLTLSFDNISTLANFGGGSEQDLRYRKLVSDDCDTIAMIAHYPNYENSELKNAGYATLTYVIAENGSKEKVTGTPSAETQYVSAEEPQLRIADANAVYLITVSDRTDDMGDLDAFASQTRFDLLDRLRATAEAAAEKYTTDGKFSYDAALQAHTALWRPRFDRVTLSLAGGDSERSNEALLRTQRGKRQIESALAQRAYYAGRYAYLCCSGVSTSRLGGMWTGEWNPGWGSKYTMDANVNLQTSSMNTGNIPSAPVGYTYFILRQAPDWEENARATHGFTDAIQAPVNTDGDKAVITETCYPYPFRYWNAGTSWMLQPLYETLQCYGDRQIPLSDEFDLNALRSVLSPTADDLSDEAIDALKQRGYLELQKDILLPLLTKAANYWEQMFSPEYYTDADGNIHYEAGKTALEPGESYCILPSYSPENNPANYPSPSAANAAIDIAACRSNFLMLISVMKAVDAKADVSHWESLLEKLPPYLFDETGALKEWACNQFAENNEHRHLSHLYGVWPLHEAQDDEALKNACIQAIENRESENEASHALIHRSLIATRLKDRSSLTAALLKLMNHKIHYDSLLTNHDYDRNSCFCTDFSIGYLGIVNESLVDSDDGRIELLPALPESGFDAGTVTGLRTRTRAEIESLSWSVEEGRADVRICSDIDQTVTVSCGFSQSPATVTLAAGETAELHFAF